MDDLEGLTWSDLFNSSNKAYERLQENLRDEKTREALMESGWLVEQDRRGDWHMIFIGPVYDRRGV